MTEDIIKRMDLARDYLSLLVSKGYSIIDLNMVEPFDHKCKQIQTRDIIFEKTTKPLLRWG